MSKDNQSATPRATTICGVEAKDLSERACQRMASATELLAYFWQDQGAARGRWRAGHLADGSDAPDAMHCDAIEGVLLLLREARTLLGDVSKRAGLGQVDLWPVVQLLQPAIDLLDLSEADDGCLTPAGAYGIGRLIELAGEALGDIELASAPLQAAA